MDWGTLVSVATIVIAVTGLQGFWITRELDGIKTEIGHLRTDIGGLRTEFGDLRSRFDHVIDETVREHGERIARLEERERA